MEDKLYSWIQSVYLFSNIYEKEPKDIFSGLICSLNNEQGHIQHVLYHTLETVYPTNCELYRYFKPAIFGVKQVKEYLLQITSPPNKNYRHTHLKTQPGGTNQSCQFMGQYSPCSYRHPGGGRGAFDTNNHANTMESVHNPGKTQKGEAYSSHCIEATSAFIEDRQQKMRRESKLGQWINKLP